MGLISCTGRSVVYNIDPRSRCVLQMAHTQRRGMLKIGPHVPFLLLLHAANSTDLCVCKGGTARYGHVCGRWDAPDEAPWCMVADSDSCGSKSTFVALSGHFWSHKPCVGKQVFFEPDATSSLTDVETKLQRVAHGKAIMMSVHVTHHAGTLLCDRIRQHVGAPEFVCMALRKLPRELASETTLDRASHTVQWCHKHNVSFTSVEFGNNNAELKKGGKWDWSAVDWAQPDLVSIVVFRDPIARLLNGDGTSNRKYGSIPVLALRHPWVREKEFYYDRDHPPPAKCCKKNGEKIEPLLIRTPKLWDQYAHSYFTDNFALRVFCNKPCVDSCPALTEADLEYAKSWLRQVTVLIDQDCLVANLQALFDNIGWVLGETSDSRGILRSNETALRAIVGNNTLYDELVERNKFDIALYQWAKNMSYVRCSS